MAKQKGAIQLSGKLDDLCYYQKKYTQGGLVRRINQAMSQRLKDDPVFENTRKANSVFGMCSMFAGTFFEAFGLSLREMQYPSVQAKMTKACLNAFRMQRNHDFGNEFDGTQIQSQYLASAFNGFCINRRSAILSYFPFWVDDDANSSFNQVTIPSNVLEDYCNSHNCNTIGFRVFRRFDLDAPPFLSDASIYKKGEFYKGFISPFYYWHLGDSDMNLVVNGAVGVALCNFVLVIGLAMNEDAAGNVTRLWRSSFYKLIYNAA